MRPDLVIVGGGLSGALPLMHLARELEAGPSHERVRRVTMVDRQGDFGRGVPYGRRVSPAYLLNETGATMDIWGFRDWFARRHAAAFDHAYLPRVLFGEFLEETFRETLRRAERDGHLVVERMTGEALAVERAGEGFEVQLRDAPSLRTDRLLLALGSLPPGPGPSLSCSRGYVHDPCALGYDAIREAALEALAEGGRRQGSRRILVLGSNATAMEFLFSLDGDRELRAAVDEVVVLSTGILPDARPSGIDRPFSARHLDALAGAGPASAGALIEAARSDAINARRAGYTSLDFAAPLAKGLVRVLDALPAAERTSFVDRHGMEFTTLGYHTPPAYADAAARLAADAKLTCVSARVEDVDESRPADGRLVVQTERDGRAAGYRSDVVINCRGSGTLQRTEVPLLRNLLAPSSRLAQENSSGRGIRVDSRFEASPGVFVLGPLLAGHSSDELAIWNLESAQRIDPLAARLAATLARRWAS